MLLWKRKALRSPLADNSNPLRKQRFPRLVTSSHCTKGRLPSYTIPSFNCKLTASSLHNTQNYYHRPTPISTKAEQTMDGLATVDQKPPDVPGGHADDVPLATSAEILLDQHETFFGLRNLCDHIKIKWPASLGQDSWYLVVVSFRYPYSSKNRCSSWFWFPPKLVTQSCKQILQLNHSYYRFWNHISNSPGYMND
jgi:hypothetical protein